MIKIEFHEGCEYEAWKHLTLLLHLIYWITFKTIFNKCMLK